MSTDSNDPLSAPVRQLEQALAQGSPGREREWAERMVAALGAVEAGLRQHAGLTEAPDGLFAGADLRRPTIIRKVNDLRLQVKDFVREVRDLRERVRQAGQAFQTGSGAVGNPDRLPAVARKTVPRFGDLRYRVEDFLSRLRRHRDEATWVVMESVTTDIGAGD
jgi:hypothetical protein